MIEYDAEHALSGKRKVFFIRDLRNGLFIRK